MACNSLENMISQGYIPNAVNRSKYAQDLSCVVLFYGLLQPISSISLEILNSSWCNLKVVQVPETIMLNLGKYIAYSHKKSKCINNAGNTDEQKF